MSRNNARTEELNELIELALVPPPEMVDEGAAMARLAAELRKYAAAPPSPRQPMLRAELLARRPTRRLGRAAAIPVLAAALVVITASVALAALPAAAPVREAMHGAVETLFGAWPGRPDTAAPLASVAPTDAPEPSAVPVPSPPSPVGSTPAGPFDAGSPASPTPVAPDGSQPSSAPPAPPATPRAAIPATPPVASPPPDRTPQPAIPSPSPPAPVPSEPPRP